MRRSAIVSAVLLSVIYLLMLGWRSLPTSPGFVGSESYSDIALQLVNEGRYNTAFRPPLYPLFLAVCMKLFSANWEIGAMFLQGVAGVALGMLVFAGAARIAGATGAGVIALAIFLANPLFQFEIMAKRETTLFTLLTLAFFAAPLFIAQLRSRYLVMSITTALAFMLRPNAVALIPIFLVLVFCDRKRSDFSWKLTIVPALFFVLILLPWQIFVYQKGGVLPITTSTNSGQTLWKGNNPYLRDVWPKADIDIIEGEMSRAVGDKNIKLEEADRELKAQAVQFIKANPSETIQNAFIKALVFFSPFPVPWVNADLTIADGKAILSKVRSRSKPILLAATVQQLFVWIGWIGFLIHSRSSDTRKSLAIASILFTLLLLGVHTLTYPETRYRWPLDIFLGVLSADYLYSIWTRFYRRSSRAQG